MNKPSNHKIIWNNKKILREIYTEWYRMIISHLSVPESKTIELGSGSGNFKEFKPDIIACDIEDNPWIDYAFDAHSMPFGDNEIDNIVMIDVLHHLSNPVKFISEAYRVLRKKGRILILEPYPSPFSLFIYRLVHPEPFIFDINYFDKSEIENKDPWDSNQAIAFLLFYKNYHKFIDRFSKKFKIIIKRRMSMFLYPASGGFEKPALVPDWIIPLLRAFEFFFKPFLSLLSFRTYIVLEKQ